MFEYKLEVIKVSTFTGKPKTDIEAVIEKNASQGWRLHTYTPIQGGGYGATSEIHLVFEKQ